MILYDGGDDCLCVLLGVVVVVYNAYMHGVKGDDDGKRGKNTQKVFSQRKKNTYGLRNSTPDTNQTFQRLSTEEEKM